MSLSEIKSAIKQLSFEQRAELAARLHGGEDDQWDDQMKRDIASRTLDDVLREVEEDIKSGRVREMPLGNSAIVIGTDQHGDLVVWFWIGTHEECNSCIRQLR